MWKSVGAKRFALRLMQCFAAVSVAFAIVTAAFIARSEYANSANVPFPSDTELRSGFARASAWVLGNRQPILNENNAMLWFFTREAGRISGERQLVALAREYQSKNTDHSLWRFIFDSSGNERLAGEYINFPDYIPDYNRLFIYGATCNTSAREDPAVLALLSPSACGSQLAGLLHPWCRTHQLMGLRFVQKNHCEPDAATAETITNVQNLILMELRRDFRVEDAYIQKVLELVESGRRAEVKAVWLRRILEAQRADGGWDGVDVIVRLPGNRVLCWAGHPYPVLLLRRPSNFHATAQGLYLLALWLNNDAVTAPDTPH